jgi:hypothetical protein
MIRRTQGFAIFCASLFAGSSLLAHHSLAGVYQMDKSMELSGEAVDVKFTNPHGSIGIAVKNTDGTTTKWVLTLGSATSLAQRGIGKTGPNAIHVGDKIKIKFLPAKDGSPLGFLQTVTMPDGRVIQIQGGGANE